MATVSRNTTIATFSFPVELLERLRRVSDEKGVTRAALLRMGVQLVLDVIEQDGDLLAGLPSREALQQAAIAQQRLPLSLPAKVQQETTEATEAESGEQGGEPPRVRVMTRKRQSA